MLNLNQIGVHFGERTLFENISLAVGNKDRVGLVGRLSLIHISEPTRPY